MNRKWMGVAAAVALVLLIGQSLYAEVGRPSQDTLEQMGLGGLAVVSDDEGMSVRGFGFKGGSHGASVKVFGNSFATINTPLGGAHSENGYDNKGKHYASGKNSSWAGVEITTTHGKPGHNDGGNWRSKPNGDMNGHPGGNWGGGKTTVTSIKFFAGGYSSGKAW